MSVFEVVLRNSIDNHYSAKFGNNWLIAQSSTGGFLLSKGCQRSLDNIRDVTKKLGKSYTHDEALTQLGFGFWRYLFAVKEFRAAGSSLLHIFPKRPIGKKISQSVIFDMLSDINRIRNRIAHHEPICFKINPILSLSDRYAQHDFRNIITLLDWMSFDPKQILKDLNEFDKEAKLLNSI